MVVGPPYFIFARVPSVSGVGTAVKRLESRTTLDHPEPPVASVPEFGLVGLHAIF